MMNVKRRAAFHSAFRIPHSFTPSVTVGLPPLTTETLDGVEEVGGADGFGEEVVEAGGARALAVVVHCEARDGDERDGGVVGQSAQGLSQLVAVHAGHADVGDQDRKSTRLNSSHANISYAVFCLKKKTSMHR